MSEGIVAGKVVVVTGAGRDIALLMAKEGAKVVVNDIGTSLEGKGVDATPAGAVVAEIRKLGGEAIASTDSVADFDSAQRIVQAAVDTYGRIDSVVNNAGILRDVIFHKMTFEDWDSVIKVILYGAFNMSRAAATMSKSGRVSRRRMPRCARSRSIQKRACAMPAPIRGVRVTHWPGKCRARHPADS